MMQDRGHRKQNVQWRRIDDRGDRAPRGLSIFEAEPLVWWSVARLILTYGAVFGCLAMAAAAYAMWGVGDLTLGIGLIITFLRVGALGFVGGVALAGVMFALIRAVVLVERRRTHGGHRRS